MVAKGYLIDAFAKLILDNQFWSDCKVFVADASGKTELTGPEKKAKVSKDLFTIFGTLGDAIFNLGIELALAYVKSQATNKA
jgi:hypothetical protein